MQASQEELLALHARLEAFAELPATTPGNYERMKALACELQQNTTVPLIAAGIRSSAAAAPLQPVEWRRRFAPQPA